MPSHKGMGGRTGKVVKWCHFHPSLLLPYPRVERAQIRQLLESAVFNFGGGRNVLD